MIEFDGEFLSFSGESWITTVKYSILKKQMLVNDKYECQNIPLKVFVDFALSESRGRYWNENIKGKEKFLHEYFKKSGNYF